MQSPIRPYSRDAISRLLGHTALTMSRLETIRQLEAAIDQQRAYAKHGSWRYNMTRHMMLLQALKAEGE